MKYTKIIVALVLAGVFAFAPASIAAEKKGKKKPEAGAKAKGKGNPILEKLGLSDDQKKEFMALQKETAAKRKEAGKDKDAQKAVQADFQAKLKEILTEEQQATYKKLQAEMRKGGKGAPKKGKKKSDN